MSAGTPPDQPTRRREIEDAASVLFRERGYAATSVRDIASAVSIRGPSLYAHVASKEDVLAAIVERMASRFEAAAAAALADRDEPAAVRLTRFVRAHVRVVTDEPGEAAVFATEWRHLSEDRRAAVLDRRDRYEAALRDLIADGTASGEFVIVDPAVASTFILTALNGIPAWYRREGHLSAEQLAAAYADLAVRALTESSL
jgi:AcrR family transcriptional regulator